MTLLGGLTAYYECDDCNEHFAECDEDSYTTHANYYECDDCNEHFAECDEDSYTTHANYYECDDCNEHFAECDEDSYTTHANYYECDDCNEHFAECDEDSYTTHANYYECEECDARFAECDEDSYTTHANYYECEECGRIFCENDENYYYDHISTHDIDADEEENGIHSYSYQPTPIFISPPSIDAFGVELEYEVLYREEFAEEINAKWGNDVYLKFDASLGYGVEVVSHPRTLEWYRAYLTEILSDIKNNSGQAKDTCGLHIHIGVDKFHHDWTSVARFLAIWGDIGSYNDYDRKIICGRSNSTYAHHYKGMNYNHTERHQSVNLCSYPLHGTIEVRAFHSSVRYDRVLSRIELVAASLEAARLGYTTLEQVFSLPGYPALQVTRERLGLYVCA